MKSNRYVIVTDPEGATISYDGPYVAITHRVLIENGKLYGWEHLTKHCSDQNEVQSLLMKLSTMTTGQHRKLTWVTE